MVVKARPTFLPEQEALGESISIPSSDKVSTFTLKAVAWVMSRSTVMNIVKVMLLLLLCTSINLQLSSPPNDCSQMQLS